MKRVIVVGVGALGSHVVQFLRNEDANIFVIDFDSVEVQNVRSQMHGRSSVGRTKVLALQQSMQFLFGRKIEIAPHRLVPENVRVLLKDADLVIDCLDNQASRLLVQTEVRRTNTPCVHGALAAGAAFGRVCWDDRFTIDAEGQGVPTCADGAELPFIVLVSSLLARSAQQFLRSGGRSGYEVSPTAIFTT